MLAQKRKKSMLCKKREKEMKEKKLICAASKKKNKPEIQYAYLLHATQMEKCRFKLLFKLCFHLIISLFFH